MRRDLLITAAGIGSGQVVVLLVTPILARIYNPEDFGIYAALMTMAGVVAVVGSLRFETAIPAVASEDIYAVFKLAIILPTLVSSGVILAITVVSRFSEFVSDFTGVVSLTSVWLLATVQGATAVTLAYCTRIGSFGYSAIVRIAQPLAFSVFSMFSFIGLINALILGWLTALSFGLYFSRTALVAEGFSCSDTVRVITKYWKFPLLSVPVALLDAMALSLPLVFLIATFGNSEAGNYSQVQRLIGAPLILAGMAVGQVFFKYAGDRWRAGIDISPLMWRSVLGLIFVAVLLAAITAVLGEPLLGLVLGKNWRVDTIFLVLAVAPVLSRMVVSPISCVFLITGKLGTLAVWQIMYFLVSLIVLTVSAARFDLEDFLLVFACSEFLLYAIYLALAASVVRR